MFCSRESSDGCESIASLDESVIVDATDLQRSGEIPIAMGVIRRLYFAISWQPGVVEGARCSAESVSHTKTHSLASLIRSSSILVSRSPLRRANPVFLFSTLLYRLTFYHYSTLYVS